jgi:hypothetical protein
MDLESITKAVEEIVEDIPVTIQINKLTSSHLSVVFSRQKDYSIEYTDLCEKVLEAFKSFEIDEIKNIKFFGRESNGDYEWQYNFIVNANSQNVLASSSSNAPKDKKANKSLVIGSVVLVLISTGVGGFTYFKNVQYQQAKQAAKQAISQDFAKCEASDTDNIKEDPDNSSEVKKVQRQFIELEKKRIDAEILILEKSVEDKKKIESKFLQLTTQKAKIEALVATGKIKASEGSMLTGENNISVIDTELASSEQEYKVRKQIRELYASTEQEEIALDRDLILARLAASKRIEESEKQRADEKLKSCEAVNNYKNKYEK